MNQFLEFAGNHTLLVGALFLSFFAVVFSELRRKSMGVSNVEPQDAVRLINAEATVLDIRSPETYARGHIVNAKNIPLADLDANLDKIKKYKSISKISATPCIMLSAILLKKPALSRCLRRSIPSQTSRKLPQQL